MLNKLSTEQVRVALQAGDNRIVLSQFGIYQIFYRDKELNPATYYSIDSGAELKELIHRLAPHQTLRRLWDQIDGVTDQGKEWLSGQAR